LSRHVSHPRKRAPIKVPTLLLFRELFWGMLGRGDGGWRGIGVSGSGYNEVLALEVRTVV